MHYQLHRGLRGPIQYTSAPGPFVTVAQFNAALASPGAAALMADPNSHALALDPAVKVALRFDPPGSRVWFTFLAVDGTTSTQADDRVSATRMQQLSDLYSTLVRKVGATSTPTPAQTVQRLVSPIGAKFFNTSTAPDGTVTTTQGTTGAEIVLRVLVGVSAIASAYHGYKRNNSVGWGIWWGVMGALFPIITPGVALIEGFGKRAGSK